MDVGEGGTEWMSWRMACEKLIVMLVGSCDLMTPMKSPTYTSSKW